MPFRTIAVALTGNDTSLTAALRRAEGQVNRFDSSTRQSATRVSQSTGLMSRGFQDLEGVITRGFTKSMIGATAAIFGGYQAGRALNAALQDLIGGAVQFDARMRNVNSISGLSEAQLRLLGQQVIGLSKVLPQSANTLAEGLYDIASSGFQGAAGVQVLTASARAATAGLTTTATSAQAIAGVLNAYGFGAAHAKSVSDSLFQTVNLGVLSFQDLAQGIGQVVGTAAAANVSIDEVGQAIATLTKGGIVPAEAFTSLNQLFAQIIQPGPKLAAVFHQLGYESGAAALQAKGLQGVMGDIGRVTGGDVTALSTLFTDIRGLRGALTLTSNQGQLYAGVVRDWSAAHKGAGATAVALAEQLKSVAAQWDLFKNRVHAAAIEAGTRLLPTILALLAGVQRLAHDGFSTLDEAVSALAPFFRGIRDIGGDLARIFKDLLSAAAPLVKVLLGLGGAAVIGTLDALATALAAVFNFVDHNRTTFEVLAGVIAALLLPSMVSLTVAFNRLILTPLVVALVTPFIALASAIEGSTGAVAGLTAAFGSLATAEGVATLGLLAITGTAALGFYRLSSAARSAHADIDKVTNGFDPTNYKTASTTLAELRQRYLDAADATQQFGGKYTGLLQRGTNVLFGDDRAGKAAKTFDAAKDSYNQLSDELLNTYKNANRLGSQFGILGDDVISLAAKNNIDLSKPWNESSKAIQQMTDILVTAEAQTGLTAGAIKGAVGTDITAMQALAKAVDDATKSVSAAFRSATDVIGLFDPSGAAQGVTDARDKLTQAEQSLTDLRARQAASKTHTVSDEQQLARARRDVATATQDLAKAQDQAKKTGTLQGVYDSEIAAGHAFVTNIQTALVRGLDPQLAERLLEAGPAKAAPILQQLVADHTGRLIDMANKSEQILRRINARVVEITRLTTLAVQSQTDRLTKDLPRAIKVQQELAAEGGKASLAALTKNLHLSPNELQRIATEFGITLPRAIQRELNNHPVHVAVGRPARPGVSRDNQGRGFADGGQVTGPGTGTSDSILARLSNGEFIVRAAVVDQPGMLAHLNAINRYASGGLVGPGSTAAPVVVVQGGAGAKSTTINVGEVRPHDYSEFTRQMRAEQRRRRLAEV